MIHRRHFSYLVSVFLFSFLTCGLAKNVQAQGVWADLYKSSTFFTTTRPTSSTIRQFEINVNSDGLVQAPNTAPATPPEPETHPGTPLAEKIKLFRKTMIQKLTRPEWSLSCLNEDPTHEVTTPEYSVKLSDQALEFLDEMEQIFYPNLVFIRSYIVTGWGKYSNIDHGLAIKEGRDGFTQAAGQRLRKYPCLGENALRELGMAFDVTFFQNY